MVIYTWSFGKCVATGAQSIQWHHFQGLGELREEARNLIAINNIKEGIIGGALNHRVEGFVWPSWGHSKESYSPQYFEGGTPGTTSEL